MSVNLVRVKHEAQRAEITIGAALIDLGLLANDPSPTRARKALAKVDDAIRRLQRVRADLLTVK